MVIFSYARELGMTVSRMSQEMSLQEFLKWQKFFKAENEKREQPNKQTGSDVFGMFNSVAKDM